MRVTCEREDVFVFKLYEEPALLTDLLWNITEGSTQANETSFYSVPKLEGKVENKKT